MYITPIETVRQITHYRNLFKYDIGFYKGVFLIYTVPIFLFNISI